MAKPPTVSTNCKKPQPSRTDGASQIALKKHGHAAQQQLNQRQQQRV